MSTIPTTTTTTTTTTHSFRDIRNDVDDVVEIVHLRERIEKDTRMVLQRHDLNTLTLDEIIRKLHNMNINMLESRADMLERIQFDVKQSERFQKIIAIRKRLEWLLKRIGHHKDLTKSSSFWNRLLHHTLNFMCFEENLLMNHVEDIWEDNEMKCGRTWRERRDDRGRVLHFQDKASWMRNRRESRVRFTKRLELRVSK